MYSVTAFLAISPIGMTIANIAKMKQKENIAIINMEDKTTVTIIVNQKVYSVDTIENGSSQVLDGINAKENSYSKAYEIAYARLFFRNSQVSKFLKILLFIQWKDKNYKIQKMSI